MSISNVAAVVVFYNPTNAELANVFTYLSEVSHLYIIDNSEIETKLDKKFENNKIEYVYLGENKGIATALNVAARKAIEDGHDWLLTMDQDSSFESGQFLKLINLANNQNLDRVGIITPWHNTMLLDEKPLESIDYPLDVMTSANIISLSTYTEVGGFEDWLFIDGVDIDYCFKLRKKGYKILRINTVQTNHNLGEIRYYNVLGRKVLCTNHNYIRRYYIARNYLYIKKMYGDIDPHNCDINARMRRWVLKILLLENDKVRKIRSILEGQRDFRKNIKGRKEIRW